jgi:hypothetical protein
MDFRLYGKVYVLQFVAAQIFYINMATVEL